MFAADVLVPAPKLRPPVPNPNEGVVVAPNEVPRPVAGVVPTTK